MSLLQSQKLIPDRLGSVSFPQLTSLWCEYVCVFDVCGCLLSKSPAKLLSLKLQSRKPNLLKLTGVGRLPLLSYGSRCNSMGSIQGLGLGFCQSRVPDRAGQLQVYPALALPIFHHSFLVYSEGLYPPRILQVFFSSFTSAIEKTYV